MKVFLSSTYNDLVEHRKAAHDALEQLGLHVIWMEAFGARPVESTKACLGEIEESDLFAGIYAHRYGYIPDDSDISITEQEFIHAKAKGKPIFCFIVNEDHPWSPKFVEYSKMDKLGAFLQKVKKQPVEFFTTPDNLANNIASSVGHYLAEHKPTYNSQIPILTPHKPTGSTLPQQEFFFGRAKELDIINSALSPESRTWGALIDGPGGIGKTALAIRAAYLAPVNLFERKIFITAKVRELTPEGEKKLTDFTRPTYLAMLDELGKELGEENLSKLSPDERADALRLSLAGKKALIIFDNLETLPEDERTRLFQFLSRLPDGNKAIVTSRRRSDVDARVVRLDRLSHDEAMQLIAELANKYPRLSRASQKERDDFYAITQGNPLFIRWIAGQLGREGSRVRTITEASTFLAQAPKGNDPLEYIFGDLLETFTENETQVLAALTYFTQPAKLAWISQMTELPERAAVTALEDLTDRSVLTSNSESLTFYLPPLAAQFVRTRRPEAVAKKGDALTNYTYALVMQYGGGDGNYKKFPMLDAEWGFVSAALPLMLMWDNSRLQMVCVQLNRFLEFTGRWDDLVWLNEHSETLALTADDKEKAGWRAYQAGLVYFRRDESTKVLECATRAAEHWKDSTPRLRAIATELRAHGYKLQEDYSAAIVAYQEVVQIDRSISPESEDVSIDLNWLADAERMNNEYINAERNYREALRIAKKINDQNSVATILSNLALLASDREQWLEAESLARKALAMAEEIGRQELIAGDCDRIANALLKQNRELEEAVSLSRRAIEIHTRLGMRDEFERSQETLAEIEEKIKENRSHP